MTVVTSRRRDVPRIHHVLVSMSENQTRVCVLILIVILFFILPEAC